MKRVLDIDLPRRALIGGLLALSGARLLGQTRRRPIDDDVPSEPPCDALADNGDVNWDPSVARPVSWGVSDVDATTGAPRPMLIYYPSAARVGPSQTRPILKRCEHPYPVVLLFHGRTPWTPLATHYRSWRLLPITLARSGFVVIVPSHRAWNYASDEDLAAALRDDRWVRRDWVNAPSVEQGTRAATIGHSNGTFVALRMAAERPATTSLTTLGMQFSPARNVYEGFFRLKSLFSMYAEGLSSEDHIEDLFAADRFDFATHIASYRGSHMDYLPASETGRSPRGPCDLIGSITADLVTLFVARTLGLYRQIEPDLRKPVVSLNAVQRRYAGNHLTSVADADCATGCRVSLRWDVDRPRGVDIRGSRVIGPGDTGCRI